MDLGPCGRDRPRQQRLVDRGARHRGDPRRPQPNACVIGCAEAPRQAGSCHPLELVRLANFGAICFLGAIPILANTYPERFIPGAASSIASASSSSIPQGNPARAATSRSTVSTKRSRRRRTRLSSLSEAARARMAGHGIRGLESAFLHGRTDVQLGIISIPRSRSI